MEFPAPCSCCYPATTLMLLGGILAALVALDAVSRLFVSDNKKLRKFYSFLGVIVGALIVAIAVFFGALSYNPELQKKVFAKFITSSTKSPNFDAERCKDIQNIAGRVLEIGPGAGANFRCWTGNNDIIGWTGVEPNEYFVEELNVAKKERNITFPTNVVWMKGENLDIEPESYDVVISSHVLCSVSDMAGVIRQVGRALKPAGTYYFLEHVAAEENTFRRYFQAMFAPIFYRVGCGCEFKELWNDLSPVSLLKGFSVSLTKFDAKMPIPLIVPHIRGTATKNK
jgi:SAM-dependent methyltransferase